MGQLKISFRMDKKLLCIILIYDIVIEWNVNPYGESCSISCIDCFYYELRPNSSGLVLSRSIMGLESEFGLDTT